MRWADIGLAGHDRLSSAGVIQRIGLDHGRIARRIACPDYGQKNFIKNAFWVWCLAKSFAKSPITKRCFGSAGVAKLVDAPDLGSGA